MSSGSATPAELMLTLSAPANNKFATSFTDLIPPPTVRGTNTCSATFETTSTNVFLFSFVAVISRNAISSAP